MSFSSECLPLISCDVFGKLKRSFLGTERDFLSVLRNAFIEVAAVQNIPLRTEVFLHRFGLYLPVSDIKSAKTGRFIKF